MTNEVPDFVVLLLISAACFVLGATLVVSIRYYNRWHPGGKRLLPLHVWTVAVSYDLLLIAQVVTTSIDPRWWRIALIGPGLVLGVVAMLALVGYEREQKQAGVHLDHKTDR